MKTKFNDNYDYELEYHDDSGKFSEDLVRGRDNVLAAIEARLDNGWTDDIVITIRRIKLGKSVWE